MTAALELFGATVVILLVIFAFAACKVAGDYDRRWEDFGKTAHRDRQHRDRTRLLITEDQLAAIHAGTQSYEHTADDAPKGKGVGGLGNIIHARLIGSAEK